ARDGETLVGSRGFIPTTQGVTVLGLPSHAIRESGASWQHTMADRQQGRWGALRRRYGWAATVRSAWPPAHYGKPLTLLAQCAVFPVGSRRNPQRVVAGQSVQ